MVIAVSLWPGLAVVGRMVIPVSQWPGLAVVGQMVIADHCGLVWLWWGMVIAVLL